MLTIGGTGRLIRDYGHGVYHLVWSGGDWLIAEWKGQNSGCTYELYSKRGPVTGSTLELDGYNYLYAHQQCAGAGILPFGELHVVLESLRVLSGITPDNTPIEVNHFI